MTRKNLRQAMIEAGWAVIDTRTSPLAYADASGKRFGTLQKNGVRVALSIGEELIDDRGTVMAYMTGESSDVILRALIADPVARGKGLAASVLAEIATLADQTSSTIYLEPVPIDDRAAPVAVLAKMYGRVDFQATHPGSAVMVRRPGEQMLRKLSAVQAAHVKSTFPETRAQMTAYLESSAEVVIQRQNECGVDVPPIAIKVSADPEFWIDCCHTCELAYARAIELGLTIQASS